MSKKLDSLLNSIDKRLYNNYTVSQPGYFDSTIKQDLPFFNELKKQQIENEFKNTNSLLYKPNGGNGNNYQSQYNNNNHNDNLMVGNLLGNQTTNSEIRKMFEQEMQPYLYKMKNDLALQMDSYRKEIENNSLIQSELASIEANVIDNSKQCQTNHNENTKKINTLNHKTLLLSNQIDDIKNSLYDITRTISILEQTQKAMNDSIPELEHLKTKVNNIDLSNEKIQQEMEANLMKNFDQKTRLLQGYIDKLQENYEEHNSKIGVLNLSEKKLQDEIEELDAFNKKLNIALSEQQKVSQKYNMNYLNTMHNVEKFTKEITLLEKKIADMNINYDTLNTNVTTLEIGFSTINKEYENISSTLSETQKDFAKLQTQQQNHQNDTALLNTNVKVLSDKIQKMNLKLNEFNSETNPSNMINLLSENIVKCQKDIDELSDKVNGTFTSINNQVSLNAYNITLLQQNKTERKVNNDIPSSFVEEQKKFNDIFQQSLNKIVEEINTLRKENNDDFQTFKTIEKNFEVISGRIAQLSGNHKGKDKLNYNSNNNFNSNEHGEIISEIVQKVNSLENDLDKTMNNVNHFKEEMNKNVGKVIEDLKIELEQRFEMEKVANRINEGHGIDSVPRSSDDVNYRLIQIENNLKSLPKKYADKIKFENHIKEYERHLNDLNPKIVQVLESYFTQTNSKANTFSERIVDNKYTLEKKEYTNSNTNQEMQEYQHYNNNNTYKSDPVYSFEGDRKNIGGDNDYIVMEEDDKNEDIHSNNHDNDSADENLPAFGRSNQDNDDKMENKEIYNDNENYLSSENHPAKSGLGVNSNNDIKRESEMYGEGNKYDNYGTVSSNNKKNWYKNNVQVSDTLEDDWDEEEK